jgi:DNA polymerase IV (DinB-like DNA polymerase)
MSLSRALELCPDLILKPVDKEYYSSISQQVMRLLEEYADVLEQTSIDEAYIDCTKKIAMQQGKYSLESVPNPKNCSTKNSLSQDYSYQTPSIPDVGSSSQDRYSVKDYALKIKYSIREQCGGLVCSIGVATNKSTSKIASDFQKPDGLTIVYPQNTKNFLSKLSVDQISGIGVKTTKSLKDMGIQIIGDLANADIQRLLEKFGKKQGLWMWQIANGKENEMVVPRGDNISLSTEETLLEPVRDKQEILKILLSRMTDDIYNRVTRKGYEFKTIGIKLVSANFTIETRETTYSSYQKSRDSIASVLEMLLDRFNFEDDKGQDYETTYTQSDISKQKDQFPITKKMYPVYIRKLGVKVSNLSRIDSKAKKAQRSILDFV